MSAAGLFATVVDTEALLDTVVAAFLAGIGVTVVFSVAIFGVARLGEMGREGRVGPAIAYGAIAIVAGLAFTAGIVAGLIVMTQK